MKRDKILRGTFHSKSGNHPSEGLYYEVIKGVAVPSDLSDKTHKDLSLFGYSLRTDYGVQRFFPEDGDVFVRNLPQVISDPDLWVDLEEISK